MKTSDILFFMLVTGALMLTVGFGLGYSQGYSAAEDDMVEILEEQIPLVIERHIQERRRAQ